MEILIRLFVWVLNRTYRRNMPNSLYGVNPVDQAVLMDYEESRALERLAQRQAQIVETFQSTASPQQGAIDYAGMDWHLFSRAEETAAQFTFYSGRSIAKIVEKSSFTNPRELATFRRVVRRHVTDCMFLGS